MPNHLFVNSMNKFAQALAAALGHCITTNTAAEQGEPVGPLYREAPVFENDNGWRIFSGGETDEYTDNPDDFNIISFSAIIADNPDIAPLLTQAEGSAWELNEDGELQAVVNWQLQEQSIPILSQTAFPITRPSETEPNPYFTNIEGIITSIIEPRLDGANLRIGIVQVHSTNETDSGMVKVCYRTLKELGVAEDNITLVTAPGAPGVPIALMNLASSEQFDALIAIGVVIRGETYHFESVSNESGTGASCVALDYNIPIVNAILTTENDERAVARIEEKASDVVKVTVEHANSVNHPLSEQYEDDEE